MASKHSNPAPPGPSNPGGSLPTGKEHTNPAHSRPGGTGGSPPPGKEHTSPAHSRPGSTGGSPPPGKEHTSPAHSRPGSAGGSPPLGKKHISPAHSRPGSAGGSPPPGKEHTSPAHSRPGSAGSSQPAGNPKSLASSGVQSTGNNSTSGGPRPTGKSADDRVSIGTQSDKPLNGSLYESLFHPLAPLRAAAEWREKSTTSYSSDKVAITHPPSYWAEVPVSHYLQKADRAIEKPRAKHYLQGQAEPTVDPLMRLRVEADVVRYGNEQLAFHANHALFACFGPCMESFAEYEFDGSRPDKTWRRVDSKGSGKLFAVLESKVKATIYSEEFTAAMLMDGENHVTKIHDTRSNTKKTHFKGKSLKIMSQVARYARTETFNTNYVALFDSDYLFLGVFDRTDPYSMKGTLVSCSDRDARRALLGWLIEAWEKEEAGQNGLSSPHPGDSGNHGTRSKTKTEQSSPQGQHPPPPGDGPTASDGSRPTGEESPAGGSHATDKKSTAGSSQPPVKDSTAGGSRSTGNESKPKGPAKKVTFTRRRKK